MMDAMNNNMSNGLGVNVWWTVPEVLIDSQKALEVAEKYGFDKSYLKAPTDRAEVSRAVYSMQDRRHKDARQIAEKATEDKANVTYGILNRSQQGDQVAFQQQTTVRYNKDENRVEIAGAQVDEVQKRLAIYKDKVDSSDVRNFLRRLIRSAFGVPKRPSGGIYFITAEYVQKIEAAQKVLTELGTGARLYVERVMDGVQERQNVRMSVEEEINARVDEVIAYTDRIEKRSTAVQGQQDRIEELKKLAEVYEELLGEEAKYDTIKEKLEAAAQKVAAKMTDIQIAREQRKEEKKAAVKAAREAAKTAGVEVTEVTDEDASEPSSDGMVEAVPVTESMADVQAMELQPA